MRIKFLFTALVIWTEKMKPLNQNDFIVYRKEKFATLLEACTGYGLSVQYVKKFYEVTKSHADALNQALHFKDLKRFYGLVVFPHSITGLVNPSDSYDIERCNRIIRIQKNARVERYNLIKHAEVQSAFQKIIPKIKKIC